jgi:hypothetical protein
MLNAMGRAMKPSPSGVAFVRGESWFLFFIRLV